MKTFPRLLAISVFLIGFTHCTKEERAQAATDTIEEVTFAFGQPRTNLKIINDSSGNHLWQAVDYQDSILLDVDADGVDDLNLKSDYYYSNGGMSRLIVELIPLQTNFEIAISNQADTILRTKNLSSNSYTTTFNSFSNYNTNQAVDTLQASPFISSPTFEKNIIPGVQQWSKNKVLLHFYDRSIDVINGNKVNENSIEQGYWHHETEKYLYFRKNFNGTIRSGWLKLSTIDYNLKVTLWEYALEKS